MSLDGLALGTPIAVMVRNKDQRSGDYKEMSVAYRPSHADATYDAKYGVRAVAGGGRSSARETIGRVAAGAIAKTLLKEVAGTEIVAWVSSVKDVNVPEGAVDHDKVTVDEIEESMVRCPHEETSEKMVKAIDDIKRQRDSCGGTVTCVVRNCPWGLGSPVFDKLEAELAKAMMSLPATKGFDPKKWFNPKNSAAGIAPTSITERYSSTIFNELALNSRENTTMATGIRAREAKFAATTPQS